MNSRDHVVMWHDSDISDKQGDNTSYHEPTI